MSSNDETRAGVAVDSRGGAVVDPTENVKALSEAANKRQDDLREASDRLHESEIKRLEAAVEHGKEIASVLENHAKEMRSAEAARLDSIRQVDVTAVRTEAARALEAIQTLAATTARDAETLRTALNTTATTIASQTSETVKQIVERIAALEKSSYEGVGKQRLADPMMAELVAKIERLSVSSAGSAGKSEGISATVAMLLALVTLAVAIGGAFLVSNRGPTTATSPQVIYAPAPAVATPLVK